MVGNGYCNDETNTVICNYDGGDCCLNIKTEKCSECSCHLKEFCKTGFHPLVADGFCNDETNIQGAKIDLNRNSIQDQTSIQILTYTRLERPLS